MDDMKTVPKVQTTYTIKVCSSLFKPHICICYCCFVTGIITELADKFENANRLLQVC